MSTNYFLPCAQGPGGRLRSIWFSIDVNVPKRATKKTTGDVARNAMAHVLVFQVAERKTKVFKEDPLVLKKKTGSSFYCLEREA